MLHNKFVKHMKTKNRNKKPTTREVSNIQNSNKKCRTRFRTENKVSRYKNPNPYAKFLEALCWWDHLDLTWQDPRRERGLQWAPKTFKTSKNTCQQKTDTKQNNKNCQTSKIWFRDVRQVFQTGKKRSQIPTTPSLLLDCYMQPTCEVS